MWRSSIATSAAAFLLQAGAAFAQAAPEVTAPFTTCESNWTFFGQNKTGPTCRTVRLEADRCRAFRDVRYVGWPAEADAVRKVQESGERSLSEDERKWLAAYRGRRAACEALLKRIGD